MTLGAQVSIESGTGNGLYQDTDYSDLGVTIIKDAAQLSSQSDITIRIGKPSTNEIKDLQKGSIWISALDPFNNKDLIGQLAKQEVSSISVDMIPRSTIAQKMDVLSSQASLGGYVATVIAADKLQKAFPMMTTPAGTLSPAKVFVIGAGVAGLQAIATSKRLGARVEAFDTRPIVEEQVQSLGAKFIKVDLGETGQTKDGYAKQLTDEQLQKQREVMAKHCAQADIVITTAQVFGKKAPRIITDDMIKSMQAGSVILDMAVESGGNVEGSKPGEDIEKHGVHILGPTNLPGRVAYHASQMLASNFVNFIDHFWNKEKKTFMLDLESDLIKGCLLTHQGKVVHPLFKEENS